MPRGHSEGRCSRNKSSFRLDSCQDTAERVPLCLTLKVFDLQQGDPAAGSSKNTSPRHVRLCSPLRYASQCTFPWGHSYVQYKPIYSCSSSTLLLKTLKSKDPRRDLRALRGQTAPTGKPIPIWGNQQDRCFRALQVVAHVHVCTYIHTHIDPWQLNLRLLHCEGYVLFSCFFDLCWCYVGSLWHSCLSTMPAPPT